MVEIGRATADAVVSSTSAPHRRPRVREVSSRFMSPVSSSSSSVCSGDIHLPAAKSPVSKQQRRHHSTEENRSFESPFQFKDAGRHRRSVSKLFNENPKSKPSRPDTPTLTCCSSSSNKSRVSSNTATAATKLLQSLSSHPDNSASSQTNDRLLTERNINIASPCSRSLHFPTLTSIKPTAALSRSYTNSGGGGFSLPPVPPPCPKLGIESRKVRRVFTHQEDVHSLRLLHNRLMQWRLANAKAEASIQAQRTEAERTLYSLGVKMSTLYDSVARKRIELGLLRKRKTVLTILESQMPYLEEWCAFEGEYSMSLYEAIQALLNTSIQLPINGNVKADALEMKDAVNSAIKLMEIIFSHVQSFMPKAEEMEKLMMKLAKVVGSERAFVEDCGGALSKTYISQVEEWSLRSQLMQLHCRVPLGLFKKEDNNFSPAVHMR